MINIEVYSTHAVIRSQQPLTVGLTGASAHFAFGKPWDQLIKTAVFRQGEKTVTVADIGQQVQIPWEVLTLPGVPVMIGVYGTDPEGKLVIPTLWAETEPVRPGADPQDGVTPADPTAPVWAQLQSNMGSREQLQTNDKTSLVAAINEANRAVCWVKVSRKEDGAYYIDGTNVPALLNAFSDGKALICDLSGALMPLTGYSSTGLFEFTSIRNNTKYCVTILPDGTVTYTNTVLATNQSKLPNPQKLTFIGNATAEYDGSEAVTVGIPTKVSDLEDAGDYLTEAPVTSVNGLNGDVSTTTKVSLTEQTDGSYLSDLSSAEIMAAYRDHKSVHCYHNKMILPLIRSVVNDAVFSGIYDGQIHTVNVASNRVATVTVIPLASGGGSDGITPHIGENGNWWIGEEDTGVSAGATDEQISSAVEEYLEENQLVKTVNGTAPDENGNVELDIQSGGGGGVGLKTTEFIYELVVSDEDVQRIDIPIDIRKYEHFRLWIETNVDSKTFRLGLIDASDVNHYLSGHSNVRIHNSAVADFSILSNDLVYFKGLRTSFRNTYGATDGGLVVQPIVINIEASSLRLYREDNFKIGEIVRLYAVPWG